MRTPTPWYTDDATIYGPDGMVQGQQAERAVVCCDDWRYNKLGMLDDTDKANLAFIVKSANSHDALVAALKALLPLVDARRIVDTGGVLAQAWAALKNATEL